MTMRKEKEGKKRQRERGKEGGEKNIRIYEIGIFQIQKRGTGI